MDHRRIHDSEASFFAKLQPDAHFYYEEIERLAQREPDAKGYALLYGLLLRLCEDRSEGRVFADFFSRLSFVCHSLQMSPAATQAMQTLRRRCKQAANPEEGDAVYDGYAADLLLTARFVERIFGRSVPLMLLKRLPLEARVDRDCQPSSYYRMLRVVVERVEPPYIFAHKDTDEASGNVRIDCAEESGIEGDLEYMTELAEPGMIVHLIHARVKDSDNTVTARTAIVMPDYLMEASTLAACFQNYGQDPRNFMLRRFEPRLTTHYHLLGNLVGRFLDDLLTAHRNGGTATYEECLTRAFAESPLDFAVTPFSAADFHREARQQFEHIKQFVEANREIHSDRAITEPTLLCPTLGLSGRIDCMHADLSCLIEQKSGKRDEFRHSHREQHYLQMLLYAAMLKYNLNAKEEQLQSYLLYSKYADGLMYAAPYVTLLRRALELRNRIVAQEYHCATHGPRTLLADLTPDALAPEASGKLWEQYQKPRLDALLKPFDTASASHDKLAFDYFSAFYAFLCREQWAARLGTAGNPGRGFAELWTQPAALRKEQGALYAPLRIEALLPAEGQDEGVACVRLAIEQTETDFVSNFGIGDIVLLYAIQSGHCDVSRSIVWRGKLREQGDQHLLIELSQPQSNPLAFGNAETRFAVEHDFVESGTGILYHGLYAFLTRYPARRDLLLGRQSPRTIDNTQPLIGDYGTMNALVAKQRCALDYFLVIGPPGTGKTSRAIRSMVEEELRTSPSSAILLMAYTNRAVDELCLMLERIIADDGNLLNDYIRLGSPLATSTAIRHRLINTRQRQLRSVGEIQQLLRTTRIIVATTSTMAAQVNLFAMKRFAWCIIDEASQLLEPNLLPFIFADHQTASGPMPAIERFVLVGDQKQLPAVVTQSARDARVDNTELNAIGVTDMRRSMFERLLATQQATQRNDLYHTLEQQGRMHPGVFSFVNQHFYTGRLRCVPLPHQTTHIDKLYTEPANTPLGELLTHHRVAFADCRPMDDDDNGTGKVNRAEAMLAIECLRHLAAASNAASRQLQPEDVGFIVPYRNQKHLLISLLAQSELHPFAASAIDTVERFQGSERNIIIYLFTIRHAFQMQFLAASTYEEQTDAPAPYLVDRKLNVALTRARLQTILIGNAPLLSLNPIYRALIADIQRENAMITVKTCTSEVG